MDLSIFYPFNYLNAGDSWKWSISLANYSAASGYYLVYVAKKEGLAVKTITSTAADDGVSHKILVSSTDTALYPFGTYTFSVAIHNVDEKLTLGRKEVEIKPDLATVPSDYDPRTYNKKCYDALSDVLQNNASRDTLETVFKDFTVKYKSYGELLRLYNYFELQVNRENGIKSGRMIQNRL